MRSLVRGVRIADRDVGPGSPCLVIAEAGVNHNGDLARAIEMVRVASEAGVDAIKFQTFKADRLVTDDSPKAPYQLQSTDPIEGQHAMLERLQLDEQDHLRLRDACRDAGVMFLSTPFDRESADLLDELGVPAFKIASPDLVDLPLLAHVAAKGKPMLVSTGAATIEEVGAGMRAIAAGGGRDVVLLHCVTSYPAAPSDINLRAMSTLADMFGTAVGLSDHTLGIDIAVAAVALGASVVEKHFTLDRRLPGPDHRASLEPDELRALVSSIRRVESALGNGLKVPAPSEHSVAAVARKSLVASDAIAAGTALRADMVSMMRPAAGLPASALADLLGRTAVADISAGTRLRRDMFR